jgi:hypothetical protein
MRNALADERVPLVYLPSYREYALSVAGGSALQMITFCPWCGAQLPDSLRDEWFDRLEELGIEPGTGQTPAPFQDDTWWRGDPAEKRWSVPVSGAQVAYLRDADHIPRDLRATLPGRADHMWALAPSTAGALRTVFASRLEDVGYDHETDELTVEGRVLLGLIEQLQGR